MRVTNLLWTVVLVSSSALGQGATEVARAPLAPTSDSFASQAWTPLPSPAAPVEARVRLRGAVGLGFLGTQHVLKAMTTTGANGERSNYTSVPLIGLRYWLRSGALGVEFGVGSMVASTGESGSPSTVELLGHVGLPVAVASGPNSIAFIGPELRAGYSAYLQGGTPFTATTLSLSARAGVEVFFGVLGVPNLSVAASVRVGLTHEWRAFTQVNFGQSATSTVSLTRFETSLVADASDLFMSSIAAHYYF